VIAHIDCPCGGVYENRPVTVSFPVDGRTITLTAVSQGECTRCGSRVYPAGALRMIEADYRGDVGRS
jgi:YgiT-type zinc finger domain-containing protein